MAQIRLPRWIVIGVVLGMMLALAATVMATPPDHDPIPPDEPFVLSGVCDFDVLLEDVFRKDHMTTFYDQAGNVRLQLLAGPIRVRLTNLDSGESLLLNIPGPVHIAPQEDGSARITAPGPSLWWRVPGVPELQSLVLTQGRLEFTFDGITATLLSMQGNVTDVCALLADGT